MSQPDLFTPPPAAQPRNCGTCVHRNARHAAEAGHCPEGYRQGHEAPCARWFGLGQLYLATAPTRRPKETLTP